MRSISKAAVALGFILSLAMAGTASAAKMVATYTGTVAAAWDVTGEFSVDPTNQTFVATFVYDTASGARTTIPGVLDDVVGGFGSIYDTPILQASLTVSGKTVEILPQYYGQIGLFTSGNNWMHRAEQHGFDNLVSSSNVLNFNFDGITAGTSLDDEFHTTLAPVYGEVGPSHDFLQLNEFDYKSGKTTRDVYLDLRPATLDIVGFSAVPEPSTWALMIAGFGLVGAGLRRRNIQPA